MKYKDFKCLVPLRLARLPCITVRKRMRRRSSAVALIRYISLRSASHRISQKQKLSSISCPHINALSSSMDANVLVAAVCFKCMFRIDKTLRMLTNQPSFLLHFFFKFRPALWSYLAFNNMQKQKLSLKNVARLVFIRDAAYNEQSFFHLWFAPLSVTLLLLSPFPSLMTMTPLLWLIWLLWLQPMCHTFLLQYTSASTQERFCCESMSGFVWRVFLSLALLRFLTKQKKANMNGWFGFLQNIGNWP